MLQIARSKVSAPNVVFVRQDLRIPWPLAASSADVVLFNLVLEHVEDLSPVFLETRRTLRPGGALLLSEYHPSRVTAGKGPVVTAPDGTVLQRIPNFLHTVSEYVRSAEAAGLSAMSVAEWTEADLRPGTDGALLDLRPQLVSISFERR